jgi:hypothetical protein
MVEIGKSKERADGGGGWGGEEGQAAMSKQLIGMSTESTQTHTAESVGINDF